MKERMPKVVFCGWFIVLIALLLAGLFATGTVLPRLALVMPFLALGSFACLLGGSRAGGIGAIVVRLTTLVVGCYFVGRAIYSPVWDFARQDIFLVAGGILTASSSSVAMQFRLGRGMFLGLLVLVFFVHLAISSYQFFNDPQYAFFYGTRSDVLGVSGTYFHRNYLAGFLSIVGPVFLTVGIVKARGKGVARWFWFVLFGLVVLLSFKTSSRGGFCTLVMGSVFAVTYLVQLSEVFSRKKFLALIFGGALTCALLLGSWFLFQNILENREAVDGSLKGRLYMAGIAFEIWSGSPLFGQGSRSYSYLFPTEFQELGGWIGNAEFAHSDYLQTLSDYGVVGLVGLFLLILVFGWLIVASRSSSRPSGWLLGAGLGVLAGEALRASFDFNLHILANMLFFAAVLGGTVSLFPKKKGEVDANRRRGIGLVRALDTLIVVVFAGTSIWTSRFEVFATKEWVSFEFAKLRGESGLTEARVFNAKAPYFRGLRTLARASMLAHADGDVSEAEIAQSREDWGFALQSNPYDGESLASYALVLDDSGMFFKAESLHLRAIKAVGKRENKYGVLFGVGWHLAKRGENARLARRPEEALFLFREAKLLFDESFRRGFKKQEQNRAAAEWLDSRIRFLEEARIEPKTVSVLDWRSALP